MAVYVVDCLANLCISYILGLFSGVGLVMNFLLSLSLVLIKFKEAYGYPGLACEFTIIETLIDFIVGNIIIGLGTILPTIMYKNHQPGDLN